MRPFRLIALTLPGLADPSIAIAASRAGGLGVLDLADVQDEQAARSAIAKLSQFTTRACGIKLDAGAEQFVASVTSALPPQIEVVLLSATTLDSLRWQVEALHHRHLTVILETTCLEQALLGEAAGVDGLIAKGHEAGGWVGDETTFILLQRVLARVSLPVWAQGGIGLHTAAACYAAGAAGVVLDAQLALTRESRLPESVKTSIARMDGSETTCVGDALGMLCRVYTRPRLLPVEELQQSAMTLARDSRSRAAMLAAWRQEIQARVGWESPERHVLLLGQDAAFAASLAERFQTVGGVLEGVREAIDAHLRAARTCKPLDAAAALARSHGTRYPIVQGPMTRVSDRASFAAAVAAAGALPFLALALLRAPEVKALLEETQQLLGDRPWGVGILGFVPLDIRAEQLEVMRTYRPPFALIAGGRPDQAHLLEQEGIPTYLHVPSPGLLKLFLDRGSRRFVFEGRECGGHVGPRSSFVLWNLMTDVLLESLAADTLADCHVLFAGGIHDALSASMVATLAAPLAERGVRVGVLMGTAYLFTEEAVTTGAIVKGFQHESLQCARTVLLETGPGHATRCIATPYVEMFTREKLQLLEQGVSADELRNALEDLNLGRLRIASKGVSRPRSTQDPQARQFVSVAEAEQHSHGMYMIGQVAALRERTCTLAELHHDVSVNGSERLDELAEPAWRSSADTDRERPCDVAIIGMACLLPKAGDLQTYWENILNKVDAITEVPQERWDWRLYFDPDPKARDKVYSKWGGFLDAVPFDPMRYGMPPSALPSIEPLQLLTLEAARAALQDAGYAERAFPRERTSVILGVGGGIADLGQQYALRSGLPMFVNDVTPETLSQLPEWTEDSFAGILLNVAAGRVANRFDLGGLNYTVDAACASSLAAVYLATRELEHGSSDMVLVGGADTIQNPFGYLCFSKTQALSPRGRCRPFDRGADGIVISEGVAVLVLKRLADAERDGDRIYAVIKAVAGSSDGRDKGLTAPRPEGQARAVWRAYTKAGFSPATVGLIEAHGTGTVAGDRAEVETLKQVFAAAGAARQSCAIGSVKSMIGHTKCTAGVAGLVKVVMALYHKVLPPTIGVEEPNPVLAGSPFYVNTEPRPWIHGTPAHPRRAGVSAFGFGGTNFHTVVEEYTGDFLSASETIAQHWPSELCLVTGHSRGALLTALTALEQALARGANPALHDLAFTLWQHAKEQSALRLAVVATSLDDLRQKLAWAREGLQRDEHAQIVDPRGIYYSAEPLAREGRVAFLFPGQGSQALDMLRDLALHFPEVPACFELADRVLANRFPQALSAYVFPPPRFSQEEERRCQGELTQTNVAQPALGAADMGLYHLLQALGVAPDMVAGHSYGEYAALCAAGVFSEEVLYSLSEARGRFILEAAAGQDLGTMAAVEAGQHEVVEVLRPIEGVWVANLNAPRQTIISGTRAGVEEAVQRLAAQGMRARPVEVACAFHSPLVARAQERLAAFLSTIPFGTPLLEVFSNTSAAPYPREPQAIAGLLSEHLVRPVAFTNEVEAMYQAGARIFVEVGPRHVLTSLTQQILAERPCLAVALDVPGRSGLLQLQHALGQLAAQGVPIQLDRLYQGRVARQLNLAGLVEETQEPSVSPTVWLVDGGRARPLHETTGTRAPAPQPVAPVPTPAIPVPTPVIPVPTPVAPVPAAAPPGRSSVVTSEFPTSPAPSDEATPVMLQFQRLMDRFLETQRQVMLAYLGGTADAAALPSEAASAQPREVATGLMSPATPSQVLEDFTAPDSLGLSSAPEATSTPALQPGVEREQLTGQLLQIVSQRTGYPPEMLDLDLNLEADLGIDSIKRVEILGALQQVYLSSAAGQPPGVMEELTRSTTLRGIIDRLHGALRSQPAERVEQPVSTQQEEAAPVVAKDSDRGDAVPRFLLTAVETPLHDQPLQIAPDAVFLITDEGRGIAQGVAHELRRLGGRVVLVQMGERVNEVSQGLYAANLTDPALVAELVTCIRQQHGPLVGVIHLLPLQSGMAFEEMALRDWRDRLRLEVKSLFYLARAAGADLKRAAAGGQGWLVAATAMGGTFASDPEEPASFLPSQGGIAGLIKTLAAEWPAVRCKVVDLDSEAITTTLTGSLLREMASGAGQVEVGYRGTRRLTLQLRPAPLAQGGAAKLTIDASWVVLITGGARGITAEVACELAQRYQPTLVLVGRSPLPEAEEPPETAGLTSPQELKAALIECLRRAGQPPTLSQVEAAYVRLCRAREMRGNLAAMQQAGARVQYYQADVSDAPAFGDLIDEVYRSYGRIDGLIHGAGIIEDKLLEEKTPDSFDRVFDTKVDSAFILSRILRADGLKFLVLFSSIAGRFGNRGQSDYAAANEVLNKLALYLNARWPGRVMASNWGPWARTGMVSAEVQRQFTERGVQLIPPSAGRRLLDEELRYGHKGEAEVVFGNGPWQAVGADLPLLDGAPLRPQGDGTIEIMLTLEPARDRYLRDHRLDGHPVFPVAMAMELMAEVVQQGWPEWEVVSIRSLQVLRGIILHGGAREIWVTARPQAAPSHNGAVLEVEVEIGELVQPGHACYRATVRLGKQFPPSPLYDPGVLANLRPFPMTVDEAYRRWLFQGPCFRGITAIEGINEGGLSAVLLSSSPAQCLAEGAGGQWLIDPVLLDSGLQLVILWERAHHDMTPLPSRFASYQRFGSPSGAPVLCYVQAQSSAEGHMLLANLWFVDATGRVVGLLEELECSCSEALNRLSGLVAVTQGHNA